uniref:Uncharacterized protein n=1 Tax=Hucho hucho TaxID=62062 RepID=A0A4W5QIN7_9TELE
MADDVLFEFLHLEMVSHIYKDQTSRGEMDKDRASCVSTLEGSRTGAYRKLGQQFSLLHMPSCTVFQFDQSSTFKYFSISLPD